MNPVYAPDSIVPPPNAGGIGNPTYAVTTNKSPPPRDNGAFGNPNYSVLEVGPMSSVDYCTPVSLDNSYEDVKLEVSGPAMVLIVW